MNDVELEAVERRAFQAYSDVVELCAEIRRQRPAPSAVDISDGFGNTWSKCERPGCGLEVVRPGKVQCHCDYEDPPDG